MQTNKKSAKKKKCAYGTYHMWVRQREKRMLMLMVIESVNVETVWCGAKIPSSTMEMSNSSREHFKCAHNMIDLQQQQQKHCYK